MVNIEEYKQELIRRYEFIYGNSELLLAPYISEEGLGEIPSSLISSIEEFLLGDIKMDNNPFYIVFNDLLKDPKYVEGVKQKLSVLENTSGPVKKTLSIKDVLDQVREFIINQNSKLKAKKMKLDALDEYYRISRYANDGKVWTSGYEITIRDMINFDSYCSLSHHRNYVPSQGDEDKLPCGNFITFLSSDRFKNKDNHSVLTEEEKSKIYFKFNDELPWGYKIKCTENKTGEAPEVTKWCGRSFYLNEERVFRKTGEYFILCPYCGYMVNVPSEIFTTGVRARIDKRCSEDIHLFRKMQAYSEVVYLDSKTPEGHQKLLRNNDRKGRRKIED